MASGFFGYPRTPAAATIGFDYPKAGGGLELAPAIGLELPVPNKFPVVGAVPPDAPLPKIPPVYPPALAPKRLPYFGGSVALLDPPKILPVFGEVEELLPNNEPV